MYVVRCYKIHFRIRGELCVGLAWLLSLISFILLILVHVGSINLGSASRSMMLVKVNTTNYGAALATGLPAPQPISNLYASNASKPLATGAGLRTVYQWGLYTYCGFFPNPPNKTGLPDPATSIPQTGFGSCGNTSAGARFQPFGAILADMADNYTGITQDLIGTRVAFRDDGGMGGRTHAAYYLITIGTALCFLCLLLGIVKSSWAFFLTFLFALVSAIMLLVGAALWASAIHSAKSINAIALSGSGVSQPLGIVVSSGNGMSMLWAAFGLTIASLFPYLLSCCTYRG